MNIFSFLRFNKEKLPQEVIEAYYNRLPNNIKVEWKRSGNFIVGTIYANDNVFMTQGENPDEFVEMVNDAVVSMEIPQKHVPTMVPYKAYTPPAEELAKLKNLNIAHSSISLNKKEQFA